MSLMQVFLQTGSHIYMNMNDFKIPLYFSIYTFIYSQRGATQFSWHEHSCFPSLFVVQGEQLNFHDHSCFPYLIIFKGSQLNFIIFKGCLPCTIKKELGQNPESWVLVSYLHCCTRINVNTHLICFISYLIKTLSNRSRWCTIWPELSTCRKTHQYQYLNNNYWMCISINNG